MSSLIHSFASHRLVRPLAMTWLMVGLLTSTASAQSKTLLRWKFKEGETLHYSVLTTTTNSGQDPTGREMKRTIELILDMTWTIKAVDPSGIASWAQSIDRVRISIASPGSKMSADSKEVGEGESLFTPIFKILVGAEFTSKMNPRGELIEIKLSDKLIANLGPANEGGPKGQFSEDGLKNMLLQMVIPLPEGPIAAGENWTRKLVVPMDVEGQTRGIEQIFTYKGPEAGGTGLEAIEFTTKMDPRKADPKIPVVYKQETTSGRFDFDNSAGRIAKSNSTEIVEVTVAMQGKETPQKQEATRVMTLSKDKAP